MAELRPIERVVLRLRRSGASTAEIARRTGKRPGTVERIETMAGYRREAAASRRETGESLRPVERVVRRLRAGGESYGEIGNRLARSGRQVRRIEEFARIRLETR